MRIIIFLTSLLLPSLSFAAVDGSILSLTWGIPFVGILLSIAICPLLIPNIWHHHFGKITLAWMLAFIIPFTLNFGMDQTIYVIAHATIEEFIPFILLLLALFTISGGILISGNLHPSAKLNCKLMLIGAVLASIMGTTGAAMLMIRPLIRANDQRRHQVHVIIFFIFLVANIGGGLTPLGDPPLFLGFLKGVDFLWTVKYMLLPILFCTVGLLAVFYILDSYYFSKDNELKPTDPTPDTRKIKISGKWNFLLLLGVIGSVLLSGIWKSSISFEILGSKIVLQNLVRDILLLIITIISLVITSKTVRNQNKFNWEPMFEIAKLFIGIFITIFPVLAILRAGQDGALSSIVSLVTGTNGEPLNQMYFWLTGILSAFLDNAPTYLVFFNLASGDADTLMNLMPKTLLAISMGSVFMGALTYIGNAPNFMVRSVAIQNNIKMPSFLGYMKWSFGFLIPIFVILNFIFL